MPYGPGILMFVSQQCRSWAKQAADTQSDMGPVIDGSTIPTRGANSKGVSAYSLHIGVKRYYKEAGESSALDTAPAMLLHDITEP